jgi:hypothetical protein
MPTRRARYGEKYAVGETILYEATATMLSFVLPGVCRIRECCVFVALVV